MLEARTLLDIKLELHRALLETGRTYHVQHPQVWPASCVLLLVCCTMRTQESAQPPPSSLTCWQFVLATV